MGDKILFFWVDIPPSNNLFFKFYLLFFVSAKDSTILPLSDYTILFGPLIKSIEFIDTFGLPYSFRISICLFYIAMDYYLFLHIFSCFKLWSFVPFLFWMRGEFNCKLCDIWLSSYIFREVWIIQWGIRWLG
jgi:hypothetical protein